MGSALSIAALAAAIDHTRHTLPVPETPGYEVMESDDDSPCGFSVDDSESPCGLDDSESPCGLSEEDSPCGLD